MIRGLSLYDERIAARRANNAVPARPLYPDGSRYRTGWLYAQGLQELDRVQGSGIDAPGLYSWAALRWQF